MTDFKSRFYPSTSQRFVIIQEYALRYYAGFFTVFMIFIMLRILSGKEIVFEAIVGAVSSVLLGNMIAYGVMKRRIAEIFFVNDTFTVVSVHDILYRTPGQSFPLRMANPFRTGDEIQFTFGDQIMRIYKEDWPEFDLVWNWMNLAPEVRVNYSFPNEGEESGQ